MNSFKNIQSVYFIGIGGIGMSSLANYFHHIGKKVGGYDRVSSKNITQKFEQLGAFVHYNEAVNEIPEAFKHPETTLIVYSSAIPETHKEFTYFKEHHFSIKKRAEVLAEITKGTKCLAVAGTHGKTTTSCMLAHIMEVAKVEATSFLGGISENYNSNFIKGKNNVTVVEADEFDHSFLQLSPTIASILSMDADHLDCYETKEGLIESFKTFSDQVSETLIVKKGLPINGITFGIEDGSDYEATNISIKNGGWLFDIKTPEMLLKDFCIYLPGKHNILNALAATAMAHQYGVPLATISESLKTFKGVHRRFSYKIKHPKLILIDDYAHHPTEITAMAEAIHELYPHKKIVTIFQPHLFSRTRDFADDFAISLGLFEQLILLDIYPAREIPIEGITSDWLLKKINSSNKQKCEVDQLFDILIELKPDVVLTLGAGSIGKIAADLKLKFESFLA